MRGGTEAVVEAAVVGMPHEIKGTGITAFCTLADGFEASEDLRERLRISAIRSASPSRT